MFDYDPHDPEILADPYAAYRRLRNEAPVYYSEKFDCWFLSRFEDIWGALRDARAFTTLHGVTPQQLLSRERPESPAAMIASLDPPVHTRARAAIGDAFKPGAVQARLEEPARKLVRGFIDGFAADGEADILGQLALRLSVRVACMISGLPLDDADMMAAWVAATFVRDPETHQPVEAGQDAMIELGTYLFQQAAARRASGERKDDVLDILVHADFEGRKLEDLEIAQHLSLLTIGGTETLPKVFATGVRRLAEHPDQRAELVADPSLIPTAFQEMLRYDMPTQMLGRVMARDKEIAGETLRTGQAVLFLWPSGNRDEREFDEPDRFDIHRNAPRILSFGYGTHMCLGSNAARMEGKVLLEELLARIPEYELVPDKSHFMPSEFLRGYESLTIRFKPC